MNDSEKRPEIRKDLVLNALKAFELLDPEVRLRVLKRFPQATLMDIYQSKNRDWLPLEYDIRISDCMMAEVSEAEYFEFCVTSTKLGIESSLLGPFTRSILHLFRISPKSILQFAPRMWNRCYRNCGKLSIAEKAMGNMEIILDDLPLIFLESKHYILAVVAFVHTLCEFAKAQNAKVVLEQQSKITRNAIISFSWDAGK